MTLWTKLILAGVVLVVLGGMVRLYGQSEREAGASMEREKAAKTAIDFRKQMHDLEVKSRIKVDAAIENLHRERRVSDAKLAELLQRDQVARDWYHQLVPTAIADHIWMRDVGPVGGDVPRGPIADTGFNLAAGTVTSND